MKAYKIQIPVAIHDVRCNNLADVDHILAALAKVGVEGPALMVIPQCSPKAQPDFHQWLLQQQKRGSLLFCHGLSHNEAGLKRSWWGRFLNRIADNEAEFAGLGRNVAARRLEESLSAFDMLGVGKPDGFVPPTWHAPGFLKQMVWDMGIKLYESRWGVFSQTNKAYSLPLSLFAGSPTSLRRSLFFTKMLARLPGIPLRLALHPADFQTEYSRERMQKFLEQLAPRLQGAYKVAKFTRVQSKG